MTYHWYIRVKPDAPGQFFRQIDISEAMCRYDQDIGDRCIHGVQLNIRHPDLMYQKGLTEEMVLERLAHSTIPNYIIHGPAGDGLVDITGQFDEFNRWPAYYEERHRRGLHTNIFKFNQESVQYALHFADQLNSFGKLASPYVILHPGFSCSGPALVYEKSELLNLFRGLDLSRIGITFETIPWFATKNLDEPLLRSFLEGPSLYTENAALGIGGTPFHMGYTREILERSGIDFPPIFMDLTHIGVTAAQIKEFPFRFDCGEDNLSFQDLVEAYAAMPTVNIAHVSGDNLMNGRPFIVDVHKGTIAGVEPEFERVTRQALSLLEEKHGDVHVVLEYGLGDEQVFDSRRHFTPQ